jgi:mannitol/fructose-specific phosphotransferase system IIA component (Ntr-type)
MRMSDFVVREAIIPELTAASKEGVIREMVESLRGAGQFRGADLEDVVRAILKRELLGSTGIGRGVAIPHTKHNGVDRLIGTVALSRRGINWDASDGKPVDILFLMLFSLRKLADIDPALDYVTRHLKEEEFRDRLRGARTREQVIALLDEADREADRGGG